MSGLFHVDVLTLLAPGEAVHPAALEALRNQGRVHVHHHLVEGRPRPGESRIETIARARNRAKGYGRAHYAAFLDRDVVLPPDGLEKLVLGLIFNAHHAALAINYQAPEPAPAAHVAMGSMMLVRPVLEQIHFRTEPGQCECACCCADLRRMGYAVDYLPGLRAEHLRPARADSTAEAQRTQRRDRGEKRR